MHVQKAKDTQFIQEKGKYDFQKILKVYFSKRIQLIQPQDLWFTRPCNALVHCSMMIDNQFDQYKQFHKIFKSPFSDIG